MEAIWSLQRDREQRHAVVEAQLKDRQSLQVEIRATRNRHAEVLHELHHDRTNYRLLMRGLEPLAKKAFSPLKRMIDAAPKVEVSSKPVIELGKQHVKPLSRAFEAGHPKRERTSPKPLTVLIALSYDMLMMSGLTQIHMQMRSALFRAIEIAIREFELDINESKTRIYSEDFSFSDFWPSEISGQIEFAIASPERRAKDRLRSALEHTFSTAVSKNDDGILKYVLRYIDQHELSLDYWDVVEPFLKRLPAGLSAMCRLRPWYW